MRPQPAHVLWATVISSVKISPSRPPIALPSTFMSACVCDISSSCGAEALGPDPRRIVSMVDQETGRGLDEGRRTADEHTRIVAGRPRHVGDHSPVEPARVAAPAVWL